MPRLALCHICRSLTRLPDPPASAPLVPARVAWMEDGREAEFTFRDADGVPAMVAKYDPALEDWVDRHAHDDIHQPDFVKWDIAGIDNLAWKGEETIRQLQASLKDTHGSMYMERDQLKDDAMACFNQHHRPKDSCIDVFSDAKLIGSPESRAGMAPNERMYLCHLCPYVHGYVVPKIRAARGDYDEDGDKVRRAQRRREAIAQQKAIRRLRGQR